MLQVNILRRIALRSDHIKTMQNYNFQIINHVLQILANL